MKQKISEIDPTSKFRIPGSNAIWKITSDGMDDEGYWIATQELPIEHIWEPADTEVEVIEDINSIWMDQLHKLSQDSNYMEKAKKANELIENSKLDPEEYNIEKTMDILNNSSYPSPTEWSVDKGFTFDNPPVTHDQWMKKWMDEKLIEQISQLQQEKKHLEALILDWYNTLKRAPSVYHSPDDLKWIINHVADEIKKQIDGK